MSARSLLAEALGCPEEEIVADSAIGTQLQWDSLAHIKIVLALEERLGRSLTTDEIVAVTSLAAIEQVLRSEAAAGAKN
jgi:acyl carrier protein